MKSKLLSILLALALLGALFAGSAVAKESPKVPQTDAGTQSEPPILPEIEPPILPTGGTDDGSADSLSDSPFHGVLEDLTSTSSVAVRLA